MARIPGPTSFITASAMREGEARGFGFLRAEFPIEGQIFMAREIEDCLEWIVKTILGVGIKTYEKKLRYLDELPTTQKLQFALRFLWIRRIPRDILFRSLAHFGVAGISGGRYIVEGEFTVVVPHRD